MNVFGIGFLIGISVVGGVIALLADNLGRTIGKKRITFRKLRPRRTAQVFTFSAGAAIPLLTVAVVAFASEGVRRWFIEGPGLVEQRDKLQKEIDPLRQAVADLEGQRTTIQATIAEKTRESNAVLARLKETQSKLAAADKRVAELNTRLAPLLARLRKAERDYASLSARNRALQVDNATVSAQNAKLADERERIQKTVTEMNRQKREAEDYQRELQNENDTLSKKNASLVKEIEDNQKQIGSLSANLNQAQAEFERQRERNEIELDRQKIRLDEAKGMLRQIQEQLDMVMSISGNSRTMPLTFHMGEEIARVPVGPNLKRADAQNALSRLLREARANAEDRGAKPKGSIPSAGIVERIVDNRSVSSEVQMQRLVDRITGLSEDFLLVATSSLNAFKSEPVSVDVQTLRNPVVFRQGELVAETRIEGERVENTIVEQIQEFVRNQVRLRAKEGGMIPVFGQEAGYGVLDQNVLLDLMRSARANNRRVRLQAWAPKDIRAGDPLDLDYRIR